MRRAACLLALLAVGCAVGPELGSFGGGGSTYGQRLLLRRCQGCHVAPDPVHMPGSEWAAGIEKMRKRLHLTRSEWDTLQALGLAADTSRGGTRGPGAPERRKAAD